MATSVESWIEYTKPIGTITRKCSDSYKQTSNEGRGEEIAQQMILYLNYTFTHNKEDDIEPISTGLKFTRNGTLILK